MVGEDFHPLPHQQSLNKCPIYQVDLVGGRNKSRNNSAAVC